MIERTQKEVVYIVYDYHDGLVIQTPNYEEALKEYNRYRSSWEQYFDGEFSEDEKTVLAVVLKDFYSAKTEEYEDYLRLKREKSLWKDIIDIITCGTDARVMEFRLFKKSVRKYVNDKIYKNICYEYNKAVTEYRNKITQ